MFCAIGNLTKDPECRDLNNSKVCNFTIAINDFYYSNGEKKSSVTYIDIECWNKSAENCTKYLSKGKKVAINGKLKMNSWEKNGQKYNKLLCLADKIEFLNSDEPSQTEKKPQKTEEKLENSEEEYDDIDDIPF